MRRFALVVSLSFWAPALHAQGLQSLLDQIAPPLPGIEEPVRVDARLQMFDRQELVVTIEPQGDTLLVADPGVTITPLASPGVTWLSNGSVILEDREVEYFASTPMVSVPFQAAPGASVAARVEYAYCVVDEQCLFGEETVQLQTDSRALNDPS